ncbi:MAG: SDR family oxidoreductase [Acidobacteriaceae bacterium]|nr:SDR family oxidoreductase [Acidobacteriaceae bacterium]
MDLNTKVCVITGVGAGIGAAIADVFSQYGAHVIGLEKDRVSLNRTAERIAARGGSLYAICTDVSSEASVRSAFQEITSRYQTIDVLVNNVGLEFYKDFVSVSVEDWEHQLGVNLRSVFLCCSHVVPLMMKAGHGAIINTASVQAFATTGQTAPYAAAKAGVLGLTRDMARDLGPHHIRVNAVCPGCISTPMMERSLSRNGDASSARQKMQSAIPLRRLGNPAEIANAVAFLASDLASYVSGVALVVDGGLLAQLPVT